MVSNKEFGPIICCLINTNMVWSQKELFYRSNFRVIHIELFVMTSGIFGFGKERIIVPFPKFAFDLQQCTERKVVCTLYHSDRISLFLFQSTTLTPPGPPWVSKEAKLSTEFKFGGLVRYSAKIE